MGACVSCTATGLGTIPEGDIYEGGWLNKLKHSVTPVLYRWRDGSEYMGPFVQDMMCGHGEFRAATGATYSGEFANNQFQGRGKLTESNGDQYEGSFAAGLRQGYGVQVIKATGEIYDGEWRANQRHGSDNGVLTFGNDPYGRFKYEGEWSDNKKHGRGYLEFTNNSYYSGEFQNDEYCGHGSFHISDGTIYEGLFDKNFLIRGEVTYADGVTYSGQLHKHRPHGHGVMRRPDTTMYEGAWVDGMQEGKGICTYSNGVIFVGKFSKNMRVDCEGETRYPDGSTYRGSFHGSRRHGKGSLTHSNGNIYNGEFQDDFPHGHGELIYVCTVEGVALEVHDKYVGQFVKGHPVKSDNLRLAALKVARKQLHEIHHQSMVELERARRDITVDISDACIICRDAAVNTIFLDCAHCACCENCAKTINESNKPSCPLCRQAIQRVVKTFHS